MHQRRQWHPYPVLLPGKSHEWRSLEGCSPWGHWGSDTTEQLHFHFSLSCIGEGNGNPFQCSFLENARDRGAWWAAVYGVAQSRTRLKWLSSSSSSSNMMCVCRMWWESGTCKAKWKITKMRIKNIYNVIIILSEINLKTGRWLTQFSSVQFSRSVMSDSLWPHESQHARPPCPSPTPGVYSDSRPLGQWCHPAISSSVIPFSSCPQSLPTRGR